jgi:glycosyltransferase involved in cell wall biosynthesis
VTQVDAQVGFVLFGDGFLRRTLEQRISARGLSHRFVLAGIRTDLDRLFPCLDLLVQSSYTEGMPNVVLEACAAGVPVVVTAVGGTPEIVEDGEQGYLVPPGDARTLSRRVLQILNDDQLRQDMGMMGSRHIRQHFTFSRQADQYRSLFAAILAEDRRGRTQVVRSTIAGARER